jgi:hypothetical protein
VPGWNHKWVVVSLPIWCDFHHRVSVRSIVSCSYFQAPHSWYKLDSLKLTNSTDRIPCCFGSILPSYILPRPFIG